MDRPPRLSLAAGTLRPGTTAEAAIRLAAAAGFDAVGLRPTPGWSATDVARRAADAGISILDIEVARIGTTEDEDADWLVDWAVEVGAAHVLVVSDVLDPSATAAGLHRVAARCAGSPLRPVLEFMRFTGVPDLATARAAVEAVGGSCIGILVDALHLARAGGEPTDLADIPAARLPYFQVCDAPASGPADGDLASEARYRRLLPGDGRLPLGALVAALPGRPISVEVQSEVGWSEPPESWVRRVHQAAAQLG